jgi:hypothetical protein
VIGREISSNSNSDKSTLEESSDLELERELAPFVKQARVKATAKAKEEAKALLVARVAARVSCQTQIMRLGHVLHQCEDRRRWHH